MNDAWIYGELKPWPSKHDLANILSAGGLDLYIGKYSIRINDFACFKFQNYGGDICEPTLEAWAETMDDLLKAAITVSELLTNAHVKHRFEVYHSKNEKKMVAYIHHKWPLPEQS